MIIGRMTGQFGRHRVRFNSEYQHRCEGTPLNVETEGCHNRGEDWIGLGNNQNPIQMSPEATQTAGRGYFDVPFYVNQGTWTMPATNQLLFDAGYNAFRYQPIFGHPAPDGDTSLTSVTEQSNAINPATGLQYAPVANYRYRGVESWGPATGKTDDVLASASYVTGAHNAKIGYQYRRLDLLDKDVANQTQLGYRFNQGVPNAVSYYLPDFGRRTITSTHSFYFQDSWTISRMTLQGALRYDRASSYAPSELNGTTQHVVPQSAPDHDRAYAWRRRVQRHLAARRRRLRRLRQRQDGAQVQLGPVPGVCGQRLAVHLDQPRRDGGAQRDEPRLDDDDRDTSSTEPAELRPAEPGAERRVRGRERHRAEFRQAWRRNAGRSRCAQRLGRAAARLPDHDHRAAGVGAARVRGLQLHAPHVPRLLRHRRSDAPRRHQLVLRDVHADGAAGSAAARRRRLPDRPLPADAGGLAVAPQRFLMRESDLGAERDSMWDGFDVTLNARLRGGLTTQLGTTTGRGKVNTCEVDARYNHVNANTGAIAGPDPRGCNDVEPWQTTVRGLASYTIPKIDVLVSAVLRSQPEALLAGTANTTAQWQVPNSVIIAALGHSHPSRRPTGNTVVPLGHNDTRIYAANGGRRWTCGLPRSCGSAGLAPTSVWT